VSSTEPPALDPSASKAAFPTLTDAQIERLRRYGTERDVEPGGFLFVEGQDRYDLSVILRGSVEVLRRSESADEVVAVHGPGRFIGELNLLTGQRTFLAARMPGGGRVLAITPEELRRLMAADADIGDLVFTALAARRDILSKGAGARAIQIIGSRYSAEALRLRAFATTSRIPHTWVELEAADDVGVLLASLGLRPRDTPVVVTPTAVLRSPTPGELAEHLHLSYRPAPGVVYDLAVIGAGPGGLAAGVYGASEGLSTIVLDETGVGGQAGASSRIENYLGFPTGISGGDLTQRAAMQAQRLGAQLRSPCRVQSLEPHADGWVLRLDPSTELHARAVIIAIGARYRRLPIPDLARFEGAGVYYAATELEVRSCGGEPVTVVGAGNSAGQAAIYLAQQGSDVTLAVRGDWLAASMSTYLVDRIAAHPRIHVRTRTDVVSLEGDGHLQAIELRHRDDDRTERIDCTALFSFIGASAPTEWLRDLVALDEHGFVHTDRSIPPDVLGEEWDGGEPLPFETSRPGVFAVGDVRNGSMKRVAAAVGEGSSAVRSVHASLARR